MIGRRAAPLLSLRNAILRCLLALCFLCPARAQYAIDFWTTENGLPQNTAKSIQQTPDGYLWFATSDGLVRFDGVRFTIFNRTNTPELTTNRLASLLAEKDGTLWICTEAPDVLRYRGGKFRRFEAPCDLLQQEGDGSLLLQREGATHLRDGQLIRDPQPESEQHNVYISPRGARWDLYTRGSTSRDGKLRLAFNGYPTSYELPALSPVAAVIAAVMEETPDEALWLAVPGSLYRLKNGESTVYRAKDGMPQGQAFGMTRDREGHIWFATANDGVCRFADGRFTCYKTADGLSSDFVRSVFVDREGTIWVGTSNRGINRLNRRVVTPLSTAAGLLEKNVYPILEDRAGDVWLGTLAGMLIRTHAGRAIQSFGPTDGWRNGDIESLYEDHLGRLWIGGGAGVEYYEKGRFTDFSVNRNMPRVAYQFIHEDAGGALWFGTNGGLLRYQDGQLMRYTVADGLPSDDVKVALWARDGTFWVGTHGGLARLNGKRFVAYTERDGLASNHVRDLHEDDQGTLWIGTYDGGLSRLRDGKVFNYTTANGLHSSGVFAILEDAHGNLWMSSNQGIYRVSRRQLEDVAAGRIPTVMSTAFGKSDGMLNSECNGGRQPAGIKSRDGRLWFPTQDGVAVIDPEAVPYNPLPPPVVIESAAVQGRSISLTGGLRLGPKDANLEIQYTGLSLVKPEQVRFRYRLEPLDVGWVDAGTRRAAFYPYLPPGQYTFRVSAANSDLVWNDQGAALAIVVLPPFYRTWWFISLCAAMAAASLFLGWRYRLSQLERSRAVQQAFSRQLITSEENLRKRIAAELHDSLGQRLVIIQNQALILLQSVGGGSGLKGAQRERVEEISAEVSGAVGEVQEISYNLRPYRLDRLGLTAALRSMIDTASAASSVAFFAEIDDIDGVLPKEAEINFYRIVQECVNNILKHSKAKQASVRIGRTKEGLALTVRDDGKGFEQGSAQAASFGGFGLIGISERAQLLGGRAAIHSAPGQGTTVTIEINSDSKT